MFDHFYAKKKKKKTAHNIQWELSTLERQSKVH